MYNKSTKIYRDIDYNWIRNSSTIKHLSHEVILKSKQVKMTMLDYININHVF